MTECQCSIDPKLTYNDCLNYLDGEKMCIHDPKSIYAHELEPKIESIAYLRRYKYIYISHSEYDGKCEWKDICKLKILSLDEEKKLICVQNGNGLVFNITNNQIGSLDQSMEDIEQLLLERGNTKEETAKKMAILKSDIKYPSVKIDP